MSNKDILLVNDLKSSLSKELGSESCNIERVNDILNQLEQCPINLPILSETLIGTVVSKFKSNQDSNVSSKAKHLIKKWKSFAKDSQTSTNSAPDKSATNTTTTSAATMEEKNKSNNNIDSKPTNDVATLTTIDAAADNNNDASDVLINWDHLPPLRKNTALKLVSVFELSKEVLASSDIHESAITSLIADRSSEVELSSHEHAKGQKEKYLEKIRSLVFNLKKNTQLREDVLFGGVTSAVLVNMTPNELATEEKVKEREAKVAFLKDSRRLDWDTANEDKVNAMCGIKGELLKASLFECGRCKSHKTTSTQKQTRSADEPMTVFVLCLNCGKRWRC